MISIKYAHDASPFHSISYSIGLKWASISISSNNSNLMVYSYNMSL